MIWRKFAIGAVAILLLGLIVALFLHTYHRVEREIDLPRRGEARYNPLFGLKQTLRAQGHDAPSRSDVNLAAMNLAPEDALLLDIDVRTLIDGQVETLMTWVEGGGRLLLRLPAGDEGRPGELLDTLGVTVQRRYSCLSWRLPEAAGKGATTPAAPTAAPAASAGPQASAASAASTGAVALSAAAPVLDAASDRGASGIVRLADPPAAAAAPAVAAVPSADSAATAPAAATSAAAPDGKVSADATPTDLPQPETVTPAATPAPATPSAAPPAVTPPAAAAPAAKPGSGTAANPNGLYCSDYRFSIGEDAGESFDWLWGNPQDGYVFGRHAWGDGQVLIAADFDFLHTDELKQPANAALTWQLLGPALGEGRLLLVYATDVPAWYVLLVRQGWPVLVPLLLALLAWFWTLSQRFGPLLPLAAPHQRALRAHLQAAGEFAFARHRGAALHAAVLRAFRARLRRRDPIAAALAPEPLIQLLSERHGVPIARVRQALQAQELARPEQYLAAIRTLMQLRAAL